MIETLLASSWSTLIALWLIILFASVIRAFTGFGFALCAVPGFSFLLSPSDSVVLSVMLTLGISVLTLRNYRNDYVFDSMLMMLLMTLMGAMIGSWILIKIDQNLFRILVGSIVVFLSIFLSLYQAHKRIESKFLALSAGLSAGLMNGAVGIPGLRSLSMHCLQSQKVIAVGRC